VKLLLDTHVFLWLVEGDARLSSRAHAALADPQSNCLLSIASIWEMAIKVGSGKLKLNATVGVYVDHWMSEYQIDLLPIQKHHVCAVADLPQHHRDPFDRLLIAQTMCEQLTLVSGDALFQPYSLPLIS
jgi:PIN domain nuclease of toxin-antitoxin system